MNKRKIFFTVLILITAAVVFWIFYVPPSWRDTVKRCTNYNSQWTSMIDCYGRIAIFSNWDEPYYSVINTDEACCDIARIKEADNFAIHSNEMYLIDITPTGICNNLMPGKYCGDFQVQGESKVFYYETPEQVPKYLVINTKTGDERFYARLEDSPPADRKIFQELVERERARP